MESQKEMTALRAHIDLPKQVILAAWTARSERRVAS